MVHVGALFFSGEGVACVHRHDELTYPGVQCSGCSSVLSKSTKCNTQLPVEASMERLQKLTGRSFNLRNLKKIS